MEGSFIPSCHREKLMNEVRSSHFILGKISPNYSTTNRYHYKELSSDNKEIKTIRSNFSHIQISANNYIQKTTESSANYKQFSEDIKVKAFKPSPALYLSQSPGKYTTTALATYKKLNNYDVIEAKYCRANKNKRNNFDIGHDNHREYISAMKHDFKRVDNKIENHLIERESKQKNNHSQNIDNKKEGTYVSTNFKLFKEKKPGTPVKIKKTDKTNFSLKHDPKPFASVNQLAFPPKYSENSALPDSKIKELKASHVTLGTSPEKYTLSSSQYSEQEIHKGKSPKNQSYSPKNIQFGDNILRFQSNYALDYQNRPRSELSAGKPNKKLYENYSNIILGEENSQFLTHTHAVYKKVPISPSKLSSETEKNLKIHHFQLGNEEKSYKTTSQGYSSGKTAKILDLREYSYKMKQSN